jgi:hypothetical protein
MFVLVRHLQHLQSTLAALAGSSNIAFHVMPKGIPDTRPCPSYLPCLGFRKTPIVAALAPDPCYNYSRDRVLNHLRSTER